jgi:AraC-like DNA-binding protein
MLQMGLTDLSGYREHRGESGRSLRVELGACRGGGPVVLGAAAGAGAEASFPWLWAFVGISAVLLAVVAVLLILQRRQRQQMWALLGRLERLEAHWPGGSSPSADEMAVVASQAATVVGDDSITPSGDVLAGRTSYVRHLVESGGSTAQGLADQAIFCVHKHLEANVTPGEIADELYVSLRTLERGLAVALDCTPSQLILAMKMREARRMLKVEHLRVSEVAERLGFANPFHFSRRFKSFYRVSPSELRQEAVAGE